MVVRGRSRLSVAVQRRLVEHFVAGTPARVVADLAGIHRNSAILFYRKLREVILARTREAQPFAGEVEVDESCSVAAEGPPAEARSARCPSSGS